MSESKKDAENTSKSATSEPVDETTAPIVSEDVESESTKKKPRFPFTPKEVVTFVTKGDDENKPEGLTVSPSHKILIVVFDYDPKDRINCLNEYSLELRKAFAKASLSGWKAFFIVQGSKYVSTL